MLSKCILLALLICIIICLIGSSEAGKKNDQGIIVINNTGGGKCSQARTIVKTGGKGKKNKKSKGHTIIASSGGGCKKSCKCGGGKVIPIQLPLHHPISMHEKAHEIPHPQGFMDHMHRRDEKTLLPTSTNIRPVFVSNSAQIPQLTPMAGMFINGNMESLHNLVHNGIPNLITNGLSNTMSNGVVSSEILEQSSRFQSQQQQQTQQQQQQQQQQKQEESSAKIQHDDQQIHRPVFAPIHQMDQIFGQVSESRPVRTFAELETFRPFLMTMDQGYGYK